MEAILKEILPQEGTSDAGESLPEFNSGSPSYSGGGTILHPMSENIKAGTQRPLLPNSTGPNKNKTNDKNHSTPPTRMVQQTFHRSMFYNKSKYLSTGDLTDTDSSNSTSINSSAGGTSKPTKTVEWQSVPVPRQHKRRRTSRTPSPTNSEIPLSNKYDTLNIDVLDAETLSKPTKQQPSKPPPIMLYGIEDITKLSNLIKSELTDTEFTLKIITRKQLRFNCSTIDAYKRLMHIVRENSLIGHTFTSRDTRPYRIVIKNLHPTTPHAAIKEAIENSGNTIRGEIINAKYGPDKVPLSTFFVNLDPHPNNHLVKKITHVFHTRVLIEDPIKKKTIPQCKRCQQYGHTKNNCLRP